MKSEVEQSGQRLVVLSAERTWLSWLRLAITLMGLGFILDRFGIFVRSQNGGSALAWFPKIFTAWMGIGLVIAGSLTSLAAGLVDLRFRLHYAHQGYEEPRGSMLLSLILSLFITIIGLLTAIFLLVVTD